MDSSIKFLVVAVGIFFFASSLYSVFLPIYFKEAGLSLAEIFMVLLFTFLVIGIFFMSRPVEWSISYWGMWHLTGGTVTLTVTVPLIFVLEKTDLRKMWRA